MRTISVLATTTILTVSLMAAYPLMEAYAGGAIGKDLSLWTAENYPLVTGFGDAAWSLSNGDTDITETVNGQPTVYFSDFAAQNMKHTVTVRTSNAGDDDYYGFVLGFEPGDSANAAADYLLIDWKQADQPFNFQPDGCNVGDVTGLEGLALSRVSGIPDPDELWSHANLGCGGAGFVTELVRGTIFGTTGYTTNAPNTFDFIYTENGIIVRVDGTLEIVQAGDFSDPTGRFGFYDFSQSDTRWSNVSMMDLEGCSSGFWKTDTKAKFDLQWTTHLPDDEYDTVFGEAILLPAKGNKDPNTEPTLLEALEAKGGKINALAREAVAALLNSVDSDIMYPLSETEVIAIVDAAVADGSDEAIENARAVLFDLNHAGCPLSHELD